MAILLNLLKIRTILRQSTTTLRCYSSIKAVNLSYTGYENVKSEEQGTPIVIMHGLFGSKFNWNSLSKAIHAQTVPTRKVISVDARNHGDSPHTTEHTHTYEHMAEDVVALLNNLKIEKAAVIGHSMGGRAMMYLALKYPHLVEKAVIVDISPVTGLGKSMTNTSLFLQSMQLINVPASETIHAARKIADAQLSKIIAEKSLRDFLITNLTKNEDGSFKWRINLDTLKNNIDNVANFPDVSGHQFDGPTLFIAGGRSDYVKKSDFPQTKKLFPQAELIYIEGAGHWVHSEKSSEFLQLVIDFLNKKE